MNKQLTVTFDGQVFHPEKKPELTPNTRYIISIISEISEEEKTKNAWDILEDMAGSIEAPEDWSKEHDHYLYGAPKQNIDEQ